MRQIQAIFANEKYIHQNTRFNPIFHGKGGGKYASRSLFFF